MNIPRILKPSSRSTYSCILAGILFSLLITGKTAVAQTAPTGPNTMMENFSYPYLEKLVQIAKESYPRVKGFDSRIDAAQVNVAKAGINWIDILSFSFIYNPNYTFNILNPTYFQGIQIGLSVNMATFLQKPLNVKSAKLEKRSLQYDKDEYMITLENLVKTAYVTYLQAQQSAVLQAVAFNNSRDLLSLTERRFRISEVTTDVYIQAQSSYNAAASAKMAAEAALLNAKFALEQYLGGRKLEEIK